MKYTYELMARVIELAIRAHVDPETDRMIPRAV